MVNGRTLSHARQRKAGAFLMLAGLLASFFSFVVAAPANADPVPAGTAIPADPTGNLTGFEIDGNQPVNNQGKLDWSNVTPTKVTDDTLDSGLVGTSKENTPSDFVCNTGGDDPGKANVLAAAVNSRFDASHAYLDLSYAREDGTGDTHVNFEFNQGPAGYDCATSTFVGRQDDDILLVFDFPGGSDGAFIQGFRWLEDDPDDDSPDDDGVWQQIANFPPGAAAGTNNAAPIPNTLFPAAPATLPARTFGEASLDLAAIFPDLFEGECRHFGTLNVRSRSSGESFESALQDRLDPTPVDLSTCGSITIHKQDDAGNNLAGATFGLYGSLADAQALDNELATCVSLASGVCSFPEVAPGTYFIAEISAPTGYNPDPDIVQVTVEARQAVDVAQPFVDPRKVGFVKIFKAITGVPDAPLSTLNGASFKLQQNGVDSTLWPDPPVNDPATCTINNSLGFCIIGPVPIGTYSVIETAAPPGTSIGPAIAPVVVTEGTVATPVTTTYSNPPNSIQIHLEKSGPDVADVGTTFQYTFAVTNTGQLPLHDVTLVELAPDRCTSAISGPVKTGGDQDDLLEPGGEVWTYTCDHLVTPADGTSLHNVARASGTDQFGRTATDDDDHDVVIRYPDLNVVKDGNGTVNAGGTATFTITVTNQGPAAALNSTLTDTLPAGTWTLGGTDAAACSIGGGTLTCNFGTIAAAPGDNVRQITVSRTVTVNDCGNIENTATVSTVYNPGAINIDTDGSDNTDSGTVTVTCPDVGVTKTGNGTINAGDTATFTITVQNFGTGTATGVTLNDPLPAGVAWAIQSDTGAPACSISNGTLTCPAFSLAPGATRTIVIAGATDQADCGQLVNTAAITVGNGDTNPDNNSDGDTITVLCPDLTIVKTADAGTVDAGDPIGFSIVVGNDGPGTAYDVTLNDPLPAGVDWSLDPAYTGCQITGAVGSEVLSCDLGDIAAGVDLPAIHVSALTSFTACAVYDNTATADASNDDPVSDEASITCLAPALSITKTGDHVAAVSAGEDVGFTITVTNAGPGVAKGVTLSDPLPGTGLTWTIESQSGGAGCQVNDGVLTCGPIDLGVDDSFEVHVVATTSAEECTEYENTGVASATNHPSVDDTATELCLLPGLNVIKLADDDVVEAGDDLGFSIEVLNNTEPGGTAFGVTLDDPLPAGVTWSIDAVSGDVTPDCGIDAGVLTCDAVDLLPGEGYLVHISATTAAGACSVYDNTAVATPAIGDPVDDDATVGCIDIEIVKDGDTLAHVGDTVTYTFDVTNTGGLDLVTVVLTDPDCDSAPKVVDDGDGDAVLAVGETWGYECTRVIEATDADPVPNTGTVVGTEAGGGTTTDADDHLVDLIHPAIQIVKTVDDATPDIGQTVTFTYVVTNTGDTTLFDIVVTDDQLGTIGTIAQLAAGASAQLTKTMVVAANSPIVNVGTAVGHDVLNKSVTDDDPETITIVLPVEVLPEVLARTGSEARALLLLAGILMVLGGAMLGGVPRRQGDTWVW